ncbi:AtpZ/AtpI family protein [Aquibacillus albus]|uniref:F0F1-type ATP synthase assembly protein I n=1 Tax=Aquibacillus albus TaxID=1168171 RepID=A0ABS2MZR6_9BACI|nr:AtpZ/AtpI family protein [Aquibacillus albus]MBM7571283.1 F0F1-type ATP synthase assembly protein I [Aquibacillus albus]
MKNKDSPFYGMALTGGITSNLVGGPLTGFFLGKWLDDLFSTKPLFLVLALLLGIVAGTYGTIHLVRKYTGDN